MSTILTLLLMTALAVWLWQDGMAAREGARLWARRVCRQTGVQLLDDTVRLQRVRLSWAAGPRLDRFYAFEHTDDGFRRRRGGVRMLGRRAQWVEIEHADHREHVQPAAAPDAEAR